MIFLFIFTTLFADISAYKKLQIIYTEQQTPQAYNALLSCTKSVQQKHLLQSCWENLSKLPTTENTKWLKSFFKKQCGSYNFKLDQMTALDCSDHLVSKKRLKEYKAKDIYIDN